MKEKVLSNIDEMMILTERIETLNDLLIEEQMNPRIDNASQILAMSIKDLSGALLDKLNDTFHIVSE